MRQLSAELSGTLGNLFISCHMAKRDLTDLKIDRVDHKRRRDNTEAKNDLFSNHGLDLIIQNILN